VAPTTDAHAVMKLRCECNRCSWPSKFAPEKLAETAVLAHVATMVGLSCRMLDHPRADDPVASSSEHGKPSADDGGTVADVCGEASWGDP
jgi:hypothetical protein